jgi:hypothetical protein
VIGTGQSTEMGREGVQVQLAQGKENDPSGLRACSFPPI